MSKSLANCFSLQEFFNCTTVVKDACPRHWKKFPWPPKDNMTQIARAIWATRGCLWGSDNEIVNFKELNVDAQVCSKTFDSPKSNKRPKGPKGPKSTKGKRVLKGKKPRQNKKKT